MLLGLGVGLGIAPQISRVPAARSQSVIERAFRYVDTPPGTPIGKVAWLAGCWERRAGSRLVEEQWMAPRGGMMLGMGRTVRGDTLVEYEQLRIYERDGKLVYAANPSGQSPAEFVSTTLNDSAVVFENPGHDFPQRVVYRRLGGDSLAASVEGTSHGKQRVVSFPYERSVCVSGGPPAAPR